MRSNSDCWMSIVGSLILFIGMIFLVYDDEVVSVMRIAIPLISFLSGIMFYQSMNTIAERSLKETPCTK